MCIVEQLCCCYNIIIVFPWRSIYLYLYGCLGVGHYISVKYSSLVHGSLLHHLHVDADCMFTSTVHYYPWLPQIHHCLNLLFLELFLLQMMITEFLWSLLMTPRVTTSTPATLMLVVKLSSSLTLIDLQYVTVFVCRDTHLKTSSLPLKVCLLRLSNGRSTIIQLMWW